MSNHGRDLTRPPIFCPVLLDGDMSYKQLGLVVLTSISPILSAGSPSPPTRSRRRYSLTIVLVYLGPYVYVSLLDLYYFGHRLFGYSYVLHSDSLPDDFFQTDYFLTAPMFC